MSVFRGHSFYKTNNHLLSFIGKHEIGKLPAIEALDRYAATLPLEYRSELYDTVRGFLSIGASNGVFIGGGVKTDQQDMIDYLTEMSEKAKHGL